MKKKKFTSGNIIQFLEDYKDNYGMKKFILFSLIVGNLFVMLFLNFSNGYHTDDFSYMMGLGDSSWEVAVDYYMSWSGRFPITILINVFLKSPLFLFNIINAFVYTSLTVLIYLHCIRKKEAKPFLYVFIIASCWLFIPAYHETVFWLTGAITYLWPLTLMMLCLLPYKIYFHTSFSLSKNKNCIFIFMMFILGFFAGWGVENIGGGGILLIILFFVFYRIQKMKIMKWHISGLLGSIIGFMLLIIAPGNFARKTAFENEKSFIVELIYSFRSITEYLLENYLLLFIAFAILIVIISCDKKIKEAIMAICYFFVSIAVFYSMILSPVIPERTYLIGFIFLITAISSLIQSIDLNIVTNKKFILSIVTILCFQASGSLFVETINTLRTYNIYQLRETYVEQQKEMGNLDVIIPAMPEGSKYVAEERVDTNCEECEDCDTWFNQVFCDYYKLNSVTVIPYDDWTEWKAEKLN